MSKSFQCDRCGDFFNPLTLDDGVRFMHFNNPVYRDSETYYRGTRVGYYIEEGDSNTMVDLCPRCTKDFTRFMLNEPIPGKG